MDFAGSVEAAATHLSDVSETCLMVTSVFEGTAGRNHSETLAERAMILYFQGLQTPLSLCRNVSRLKAGDFLSYGLDCRRD